MSEMEHICGKMIPLNVSTLSEQECLEILKQKDVERDTYYKTALEQLISDNVLCKHGGLFYKVESKYLDDESDVFNAAWNSDGSISFELVYYNGGCCESEALGVALKKLPPKPVTKNKADIEKRLTNAITEACREIQNWPDDSVQDIFNGCLKSWQTGYRMDNSFNLERE